MATPTMTIAKRRASARYFREPLSADLAIDMVYIPGGTSIVGAPAAEAGTYDNERPQHEVQIAPFCLGKFPVTQAQYTEVMGKNPSRFRDRKDSPDRPVEQVTWAQAVEFCEKLTERAGRESGKVFRLPSEAEWEYACRAMTAPPVPLPPSGEGIVYPPFHFGETIDASLANYNASVVYGRGREGTAVRETSPVGKYQVANAFGLYDMHGNVLEWCADTWHDTYLGAPSDGSAWIDGGDENKHVLRGGAWDFNPRNCRSAYRFHYSDIFDDVGFRLACHAPGFL